MTTTISVPDRKYTCIDMTALYCHLCHCHTTYLQILLQVCNLTKTNLTIFPFHNILINDFQVIRCQFLYPLIVEKGDSKILFKKSN